jgi:hypothetical protein
MFKRNRGSAGRMRFGYDDHHRCLVSSKAAILNMVRHVMENLAFSLMPRWYAISAMVSSGKTLKEPGGLELPDPMIPVF